jgi:hypothetical protein
MSQARISALVTNEFGPYAADVVALYAADLDPTSSAPPPIEAMARVTGDAQFVCEARRLARAIERAGTPIYLYSYEHEIDTLSVGHVVHGVESNMLFGSNYTPPLFPSYVLAPQDLALHTAMAGYWTRFAATGNPNRGDDSAFSWPPFTRPDGSGRGNDKHIVLRPDLGEEARLREPQYDFFEPLFLRSVLGAFRRPRRSEVRSERPRLRAWMLSSADRAPAAGVDAADNFAGGTPKSSGRVAETETTYAQSHASVRSVADGLELASRATMRATIALACPRPSERSLIAEWLRQTGYDLAMLPDVARIEEHLQGAPIEALIADLTLVPREADVRDLVRRLGANRPLVALGESGYLSASLRSDLSLLARPLTREAVVIAVGLALAEGRPARRYPRKPVEPIPATANGLTVTIREASVGGVGLELAGGRTSVLPPFFRLRVPEFGVHCVVKRAWMTSSDVVRCGGTIEGDLPDAARTWAEFAREAPAPVSYGARRWAIQ